MPAYDSPTMSLSDMIDGFKAPSDLFARQPLLLTRQSRNGQ